MGMTQRVHRTLLVFLLFIGAGIAVAVPLECYRQPPSEGDSVGDDGDDAASSSSSIVCEFRVVENASGTTNPSGHHQYTLDKLCWRETNNENGPTATTTTCLSGAVHLTTTVDVEQVGEDDSFSSPSTDVHGNDNEQETEQKKDTLSSATASNQRTIVVGRAMYHEPYSQHGNQVAMVLDGAPSIDVDPNSQHWIDWYIQLAAAHYPTAGKDPATDEVWVQVELTINAYEQAIQAIQRHEQKPGSISFENEVLLASVYYHLGESYSLDPEYRYVDQTVQALKSSHARFQQILQLTSLHAAERMAIESKFAEVCSKLGIALMSSLDPVETIPAWARTMMTMAMDPMDSDNNFNHAQQPRQHPEYSESTTTLDIIQSYFQEAIQIFDRHLHVDDGGGEMLPSSTDTLWSRLITPQDLKLQYAMALQQSATISSIQGHFAQAKQRYEQALKIQHDVLRVGGGAEGGHYLQDPSYAQTSIADLHLSLSDTCVQLGDYPCAREHYAQAMTAHIDHNVRVAPVMSLEMDISSARMTATKGVCWQLWGLSS
jgi:tetratricopeptide (TPR) repeat protein